ncbi:MAG: alpha-glucosidase [Proteobacteria bacterium]|nr:alpha-glucosidase [Pseudomonadota bacterium]
MAAPLHPKAWWQGAVIYQIYPRSFQDSNADGVGDILGIITRLPYLASLGVDALWLSPIFKSPQRDFGYDVSDYRAIDPLFGTMVDCEKLIAEAHKQGLKIIFDVVLSHTSHEHEWFKASRASKTCNRYVWANPKPDGSPPNNWVSVFGGPAWTFDPLRGQYYLHNFLPSQPDLNFHDETVQHDVLETCQFWFDKGVDGLRLDVVNFYFHDKLLRDNPARDASLGAATQFEKPDPYNMQNHVYDKSQPENLAFIERLRKTAGDKFLLGEIGDDRPLERMAEYGAHNRLDTCYSFAFMAGQKKQLTPDYIKKAVMDELAIGTGKTWPTWAFSNHDVVRAPTRFGHESPEFAKMLLALLTCLRGTVCLYQGEELGLPEAILTYEQLQDPWGKHLWPVWQGRDGCRTPMPWNNAANMGFTDGSPWLPLYEKHTGLSAEAQQKDERSTLKFAEKLLHYRRKNEALIKGNITFLDTKNNVLAFTRHHNNMNALCVFNLGNTRESFAHDFKQDGLVLASQAGLSTGAISLDAFGFAIVPISSASKSLAKA